MRIFLTDKTTRQFKSDQQGQSIYIYYGDKPIPIKHRKTPQHLWNSSCGTCKHCRGATINGHKTLVGTDIIICEPCEAESKKQVITSTSLLQI